MSRKFNNRDENPYKSKDHKDTEEKSVLFIGLLMMAAMGIGALAVHFFYQIILAGK